MGQQYNNITISILHKNSVVTSKFLSDCILNHEKCFGEYLEYFRKKMAKENIKQPENGNLNNEKKQSTPERDNRDNNVAI